MYPAHKESVALLSAQNVHTPGGVNQRKAFRKRRRLSEFHRDDQASGRVNVAELVFELDHCEALGKVLSPVKLRRDDVGSTLVLITPLPGGGFYGHR